MTEITQGDQATLEIGDIRYRVFCDICGPWVCAIRLKSISSKGRNHRWEALDTDDPYVFSCQSSEDQCRTKEGAITRFQELYAAGFFGEGKRNLKLILQAEKLRERIRFKEVKDLFLGAVASSG